MKVKIAYPMDSDGVPEKIIDLLNEELENLKFATNRLKLSLGLVGTKDKKSIEHASYLIDSTRQSLSDIDQNLLSNHSILDGYLQLLSMDSPEQTEIIEEAEQSLVDPYGSPPPVDNVSLDEPDNIPRYPVKEKQYRSE